MIGGGYHRQIVLILLRIERALAMMARRIAFSGHGNLTGIGILILMESWVKVSCRVLSPSLVETGIDSFRG